MKKLLLLFTIFLSNTIFANSFLYEEKRINPLLIPNKKGQKTHIKEEYKNLSKKYKILNEFNPRVDNVPDYFIGVKFSEIKSSSISSVSYYNYIGYYNDNHYLLYNDYSTGSGVFSSLLKLKYDGNQIYCEDIISSGDRDNGGIVGLPVFLNGKIYFDSTVNLSTLLERTGIDKDYSLNVSFCAICGIALLRSEYDINTNQSKVIQIRFYDERILEENLSNSEENKIAFEITKNYIRKNLIIEGDDLKNYINDLFKAYKK